MGAFDDFCGSPYWNTTLTWDTDDPDFTPCFEKTALVWTPCLFLWIFLPLEVHYIRSSVNGPIRWNALNVSKLVLNFAAVVLSVVSLGYAIANSEDSFPVDYVTPIVRMLSYGLTAFLLAWNRSRGVRTSGLLSLFWFFVTVLTIPEFRTEINMESGERQPIEQGQLPFVVSIIHFPVVTLILLLNCFVDREPVSTPFSKMGARCPEFDSSFFNRLVFGWYDKMAWTGFRRPLEQIDLWELNPSDKSDEIVKKFYKHWNKRNKKAEKEAFRTGMPKKTVSVLPVLFKCFGGSFIFASVLELVGDLFIFVSPQILKLLMAFVSTPGPMWKGIFYAFIMLISAVVQILLLAQFNVRMNLVGMRIRTALVSAIYRKSLSMSNVARKEKTVGEIVTLMAVDAQRFQDLGGYLVLLWSSPLQILIALFFLWDILGVAVLAGLVAMILLVPVNGYIANRIKDLQMKQMKNKDVRAKLMNEILNGIRVLKLYAWELPFGRKVNAIRLSEMDVLRKSAYLSATISFAFTVAPFLMSLVSFITYVLLDKNNVLDAQTVFVSLSLFNIMRLPLIMLPIVIMVVAQAAVSLKRINNFMNADDLSPDSVTHDQADGADTPIKIQDGNFAWGPKEPPVLRDINLEVPKGSLVAVVGAVGCGKTSLLSAILGELERQSGQVNTMGSVAYVPQQAWIQNAKLKDNILFTKPLDSHFYSKVVDACALKPDFDMLAAGDQTEIGFKGINLSGGQKQRVSLARATYNDADVYLLDDPLSAVDSHVGKHIFDRVIGPAGLLKNKTRVLVTHGISFLPQVDRIVVIKDGAVSEEGTYQELLQRKGAFAEFLVQHIQEAEEEDDEPGELEDIKAHLEKAVGREELQRQLSLTGSEGLRSRTSSTGGSIKRNGSLSGSRRSLKEKEALPAKEVAGEKLIEDEGLEQGNVKMRVYLHYIKSIGLNLSLLTVFFNLCFQAFSVGANVWVTEWTKDPVMNDPNATDFERTRNVYLGVYAAFGGGQAIFSMTSAFVFSIGCIASSAELHNRMFDRTMKCPMSFFDVTPIGRILNRFTKDVDSVDNLIPTQIRQVLSLFFSAIATLVVISYSTPIFIAFIVPLGILYYFLQRFYVSTSRQLKRLDGAARSPIYSHFTETLVGASSIRAYGMVDSFIQEAETRVDVNQKCYFPAAIANRWLSVRLETLGNTITFFAALLTVFRQNNIDSGTVGLSISYALQITAVLNYLVRFVSEAENSIVSVERIQQYEETPQEKPWLEKHVEVSPDWPSEGAVEFRQLALRYRDGLDLVLKGIDVSVGAGEKVGIVGRTGAGKSSLTLGLFRIVEAAAGHILIDGVDISHVDLSTLRSRVTIIPQDPVLFTGSLRLNLDPHEKFSDEEVWRALERSHLKTHVQGFAAGLNHEMNEGGENFSVGQRQLVCLARALLRKTKVLVFDEATAAVDLETDDLIQKTIREDFKDCTILTIAHRLNTIIDSDRVLVLEKGMVAEYDSPQTLLQKKDSMFYSLAKDAGLV